MIFKKKFKDYAEKEYFPEMKRTLKPSTYSTYLWNYRTYLKDWFSNVNIQDINSPMVQEFYEYLTIKKTAKGKYLSKASIKRGALCLLKTILNTAISDGIIKGTVIKLKHPASLNNRVEDKKEKFMNEKDYKKITEILKEPDTSFLYRKAKIFCILALYQGLRIGEACGLKWEDIDFENKTITIKRTVLRITDGDGTSVLSIGTPKSKTSARTIPMLDFTAEKLAEYKEYRLKIIKASKAKGTFFDMNNYFVLGAESPTEPRTLREAYERFLKKYEINYINPHALRHTFCTNAIDNDCPVNAVSQILGHSNTAITMNIYNHLTQNQINKTTAILNNKIGELK